MSDLTFNKIAGGVLAAGLTIFLLKEVTTELFATEPPEKPGYAIQVAVATEGGAAAGADVPPDWGTVLPAASIDAGKTVSAKCASCHNFEMDGPNGIGPSLFGVIGRKPGNHPGFAYSASMTEEGSEIGVWDFDHLNAFLTNPQKYIAGTKMSFVGLKNPDERVSIIAYLHSLGATLPIPAPKPSAAAAPTSEGQAPAAMDATATTPPAATPAKG